MTTRNKSEAAVINRSVNQHHQHQMEVLNAYRPSSVKLARIKHTVKHPAKLSLKSPEDMYDEIITLKKLNSSVIAENSVLKAKLRRAEEENMKKNEDLRRTLADKGQSSNTVVNSLKQKVLRLEHLLREKEEIVKKLQSDSKTTKMQELKIQLETYYQEITRLKNQLNLRKDLPPKTLRNQHSLKQNHNGSNTVSREKNESNQYLLDINKKLEEENQLLRIDLERALAVDGILDQKEYAGMNQVQLLRIISDLENKISQLSKSNEAGIVENSDEIDFHSSKLQQWKDRENGMISEIEKLKHNLKLLKEDRLHYHELANKKEKQLKELQAAFEKLKADHDREKALLNNLTSANHLKRTVVSSKVSASPTGSKSSGTESEVKFNSFHRKSSSSAQSLDSTRSKTFVKEKSLMKSSGTDTDTEKCTISSGTQKLLTRKSKSADVNIRRPKLLMNTMRSASEPEKPTKKAFIQNSTKTQKNSINLSSSSPNQRKKSTTFAANSGGRKEKKDLSSSSQIKESTQIKITNDEKVKKFRENVAAKRIQRSWKKHLSKKKELQRRLKMFQENRAAKVIQNNWKCYLKLKEDYEKEQAIIQLQSILQGHITRTRALQHLQEEASFVGHSDEGEPNISSNSSSSTDVRLPQSTSQQKSDYDDDDDIVF